MSSHKKIFLMIGFGLAEAVAILGWPASSVHAETRVGGVLTQDTVWSASASPYLLTSDITIPDGIKLTIGSGVSVAIAPEAETGDIGYNPPIYVTGGSISILGEAGRPASLKGIGIYVSGGSAGNGRADISYGEFKEGSHIYLRDSFGSIASTSFAGAPIAVGMKDSVVSVKGSQFRDNKTAIMVEPHQAFMLGTKGSNRDSRFGTGGIGNVLAEATDLFASSSLTIRDSSFADNSDRAVRNGADFTVDATGNWWGNPGGPAVDGENGVSGLVAYGDWLTKGPAFDGEAGVPACCSSVLFIPGLESSRLYRPEPRPFGLGTDENQLWEPNRNADVVKLFLDPSGSSTDSSIYSGGPIDKALGLMEVYGDFMRFMDGLKAKGTMNEWRAFGYDWRKPVAEVVAGNEKKATTTESLMQIVDDMASASRTGKVSIVAHSNGGLVAKYLVKTLADMGKAGIVDSVISVAVPYLGTPEAIAGLLHGDDQAILGGLILNKANARMLAANMPSAYSLLPSRGYFSKIFMPTLAFASTTADSFEAQSDFIADAANTRNAPRVSNTAVPIKGNRLLMTAADALHGILDPFIWPSTIARWAIIGWNATTTSAIRYSSATRHSSVPTLAGDGTVVAPSAYDKAGESVSIDLSVQSRLDGKGISHSNILASSGAQASLDSILNNPASQNTKVIDKITKLPGVTIGEIDWKSMMSNEEASRKEIRVSTHSPVKLHVYDSRGNHTGEIPLPLAIASRVESGLYTMKEEKIPGSAYEVPGCTDEDTGDCDTAITLPDNGEKFTVSVESVGTGTFTLDIDRIRGTTTVETVEWSGVPVSPLSVASTTFAGDFGIGVSFASSTLPLRLDIDGDGASESVLKPGRVKDQTARLELIRRYFSAWNGRFGHVRFRDLRAADRKPFKDFVEAFRKRFGRS